VITGETTDEPTHEERGAVLRKVFLIFLGAVAGAAVTLVTPQPRTVVEASSAKAAAEALSNSAFSVTYSSACARTMSRSLTMQS